MPPKKKAAAAAAAHSAAKKRGSQVQINATVEDSLRTAVAVSPQHRLLMAAALSGPYQGLT